MPLPQFCYGRNFPKRAPALKFASIVKAIPEHPLAEDYLSQLSNWKILGNDAHGDCMAVAWANGRRFTTLLLTGKEYYPSQQEVYDLYKTQNPNFPQDDDGMDMQSALECLHHNGGPDGVKLVAFASVNVSNLEEVKAALYIFGGLLLGIEVQGANQYDFANGVPWDYHPGEPVIGGHAVLAGGYLGQSRDDVRFITWGAETGMTDNYWDNLVDNCRSGEAWVCLWPENFLTRQFVEGIDMDALAADYQILTGRALPIPEPAVPSPANPGCSSLFAFLMKNGMKK